MSELDAAASVLAHRLDWLLESVVPVSDPAFTFTERRKGPPMMCPACAYAKEHGSWPAETQGTHCRDCHRTWTGRAEVHCPRCHIHFSSDSTADIHAPYCTDDTEETMKRLLSARTSDRTPRVRLRRRVSGSVVVRWHPEQKNGSDNASATGKRILEATG